MKRHALLILALAGTLPALAQESASFKLKEHAMNAGGHPAQGTIAQSASFRVSLDAIGDSVSLTGMASPSFGMDAGFVAPYPPPQEVTMLRFQTHEKMTWNPEKSTGAYNVYRGLVDSLAGLAYGACHEPDVLDETTSDGDVPSSGDAYFYLVTAENLIAEEGTKGFDSVGAERPNPTPCP